MQNSSSKVQARLPKSQPGTLSEARKNKKGKRYPHLHCLPARGFQGGSSKVSPGSRRVPAMFQRDLSKVPAGFQQGSSKVLTRPRVVPAAFRFSGACILLAPPPAPEIETQQNRCWEYPDNLEQFKTYCMCYWTLFNSPLRRPSGLWPTGPKQGLCKAG